MCCGRGKINQVGCSYVTVSSLNAQLDIYNCVKNNNLYSNVNMTSEYIENRINLITLVISDKLGDPDSCKYSQYYNSFNEDITNIVKLAPCP